MHALSPLALMIQHTRIGSDLCPSSLNARLCRHLGGLRYMSKDFRLVITQNIVHSRLSPEVLDGIKVHSCQGIGGVVHHASNVSFTSSEQMC